MNPEASCFVAHRGYAFKYPENTLLAMAKAVEAGALFLECDIQLTSDHIPVLHHDPDLARSAGCKGTVMELSFEELSRLSFGEPSRFGRTFEGTEITPLKSMVKLLSDNPDVSLFVELKEESLGRFGTELMVRAVIEAIKPVMERCIAISFATAPLVEARRQGWQKTGWVVRRYNEASRRVAESLSPDYLFCNHEKISAAPGALWKGNWKWALYEITDPALATKWLGLGADMIETMRIGEMLDFHRGKGNT
ncbi:MAG: glycerophosphodiester phosphodiesterase [Nitrospinae bacterium]|nr:glycerophosphodiester phosphodiesterase [Nitrospinota bacterium]